VDDGERGRCGAAEQIAPVGVEGGEGGARHGGSALLEGCVWISVKGRRREWCGRRRRSRGGVEVGHGEGGRGA
jgi:hypothetical protein